MPPHTYRHADDARGDGADTNTHQPQRHRVRGSESCRRVREAEKISERKHGREVQNDVSKHGRDHHRRRLSRGGTGGAKRKETSGAGSGGYTGDFGNPRKEVRSNEQSIEQRDEPSNERTNANESTRTQGRSGPQSYKSAAFVDTNAKLCTAFLDANRKK